MAMLIITVSYLFFFWFFVVHLMHPDRSSRCLLIFIFDFEFVLTRPSLLSLFPFSLMHLLLWFMLGSSSKGNSPSYWNYIYIFPLEVQTHAILFSHQKLVCHLVLGDLVPMGRWEVVRGDKCMDLFFQSVWAISRLQTSESESRPCLLATPLCGWCLAQVSYVHLQFVSRYFLGVVLPFFLLCPISVPLYSMPFLRL